MKSRLSFSRKAIAITARLVSVALYIFSGTSSKRLRLQLLQQGPLFGRCIMIIMTSILSQWVLL